MTDWFTVGLLILWASIAAYGLIRGIVTAVKELTS